MFYFLFFFIFNYLFFCLGYFFLGGKFLSKETHLFQGIYFSKGIFILFYLFLLIRNDFLLIRNDCLLTRNDFLLMRNVLLFITVCVIFCAIFGVGDLYLTIMPRRKPYPIVATQLDWDSFIFGSQETSGVISPFSFHIDLFPYHIQVTHNFTAMHTCQIPLSLPHLNHSPAMVLLYSVLLWCCHYW